MTGKRLRVVPIRSADDASLRQLASDLAEEIERGEIVAALVAVVHHDDHVSTRWGWSRGVLFGCLMGAANLLNYRLLRYINDDETYEVKGS